MERKVTHLKGPELSRIVTGAWRWKHLSTSEVDKLIHTSIQVGMTSFDHADIYGDYENEKIFGNVIKANPSLRKNIQLISKCGIKLISSKHPQTTINHYDTSKKHILATVDHSLACLGTDYLDVLLIHRPDPLMDPEEVSEAFGLLKQNGKVLHFGVSNFTATQFEMLQSHLPFPLITNQIEVSLSCITPLFDGTVDMLMKNDVSPMAWSPLGGGKLFDDQNGNDLWSKKEKYKATEAQLSLAWLLRHPSGMFPVIGTSKPERIIECAKAAEIRLERQDWFDMLKATTGKDVP
ncbi:MAG: aldo/keto reductase [Bacteroidota bacterium]